MTPSDLITAAGETGSLAHGWGLVMLAGVELGKEDYAAAARDAGGLYGASIGLMVASAVALSGSRLTRMAELLGAAEALAATIGAMPVPFGMRWLTEAFGNAVATLDPAAFERHRRIGADRVQSDTAGYLAEVLDDLDVSIPHQAGKPLLTRREREVAALVARGRTNRQIARALGISERTAEVHVHNIAGKLGASGRAEVAVWFATDPALHGGEST